MFERYADIVGIKELQEMLGTGRDGAYDLLRMGEIKHLKLRGKYRIPKKFIIEYIEKKCI